ncbi:uncharacterized protein LOC142233838 [Haematobia irritans]|uniref:uncharacterized protein LOC142233838 n=1 Tax=Haematobia irritans TaxID=7368 RepID=UPI003F50A996
MVRRVSVQSNNIFNLIAAMAASFLPNLYSGRMPTVDALIYPVRQFFGFRHNIEPTALLRTAQTLYDFSAVTITRLFQFSFLSTIIFATSLIFVQTFAYNYQPLGGQPNNGVVYPSETPSELFEQVIDVPLPQPTVDEATLPPTPLFNKEFYTFAAPEEHFNNNAENEQILSTLKKQLRIIFIRTPENKGLEKAALNLFKQSGEEHTAIYVLTQQTDIGGLAQQLQTAKTDSESRPEVHFIKYRTQQDAINAQRTIQEQYNTLPGHSRTVNGGQANILDFTPTTGPVTAPVIEMETKQQQQQQHQYQQATKSKSSKDYLPSTLRRRFRLQK